MEWRKHESTWPTTPPEGLPAKLLTFVIRFFEQNEAAQNVRLRYKTTEAGRWVVWDRLIHALEQRARDERLERRERGEQAPWPDWNSWVGLLEADRWSRRRLVTNHTRARP